MKSKGSVELEQAATEAGRTTEGGYKREPGGNAAEPEGERGSIPDIYLH